MRVPAGEHAIAFTIHSRPYGTGGMLSSLGSLLLLLLIVGVAWKSELRPSRTSPDAEGEVATGQ